MWIESHQELRDHPKLKKAARMLGVSRPQMIGHLHLLWWWALDYAQDGNLSGFTPEDVADAAAWEGDAGEFMRALIECRIPGREGFVEGSADGELNLHDWHEYAGKLLDRRETERDRQRRRRAAVHQRQPEDINTLQQRPAYVSATTDGTVPTVPTVPNQQTDSRAAAADAVSAPESNSKPPAPTNNSALLKSEVAEVWEYYRLKVQPRATVCPEAKIKARLKRFGLEKLRESIDRFCGNYWWYERNKSQGGEWFFRSDSQIDRFLLLPAETEDELREREGVRSNGKTGNPQPISRPLPSAREATAAWGRD